MSNTDQLADALLLDIRYTVPFQTNRGRMVINLPMYMMEQPISKIRKLIAIIQKSDTPDEVEKVRQFLESELSAFDGRMRDAANKVVDARTREKELQSELEELVAARDRFKKNTPPYKSLMEKIKAMRSGIAQYRSIYRAKETEIKRLKRNSEKFKKLTEDLCE